VGCRERDSPRIQARPARSPEWRRRPTHGRRRPFRSRLRSWGWDYPSRGVVVRTGLRRAKLQTRISETPVLQTRRFAKDPVGSETNRCRAIAPACRGGETVCRHNPGPPKTPTTRRPGSKSDSSRTPGSAARTSAVARVSGARHRNRSAAFKKSKYSPLRRPDPFVQ